MADELDEHRVSVTVFATVRAVDAIDGGHIVERVVRQALLGASTDAKPLVLPFEFRGETRPIHVHKVMETGTAAGNGYLWLRPTARSFQEGGL